MYKMLSVIKLRQQIVNFSTQFVTSTFKNTMEFAAVNPSPTLGTEADRCATSATHGAPLSPASNELRLNTTGSHTEARDPNSPLRRYCNHGQLC